MIKPLFVVSCPIDTFSGYGARSRDIVKALLKLDKYDVKILSQRWGNCSQGFLQEDNIEHKTILDCILSSPQLPKKPDVWMQITVPNEFQPIGEYNIGMTAGIETDLAALPWIEGLNKMNLIIVSSEHSKKVFQNTKYEKRDKVTNNLVETTQCRVPIEVLFEGYDDSIFDPDSDIYECELISKLDEIPEKFCFLHVGHWLQGGFGEDRKNIGKLVKTFLETFKNRAIQPALILKSNGANTSIMDRDEILNKINTIRSKLDGKLPNIYLLHGEISDLEMNELYNHEKVKSFVSFTKGEGFGRPLLESSIYQIPVIAPNNSGQIDFLNFDYSISLPGKLDKITPGAVVPDMLVAESKWFEIDEIQASKILLDIYSNYKKFIDNAKRQSYFSKSNFTFDKMKDKLDIILESKIIKKIELKLPKLVKI